ncbi:MAG: asparaginase [Actinomycetota bacterium]
MSGSGSFTIEVVRGGVVESSHVIHAVVADRQGRLEAWGDRHRPTIARSAIKAVQALPLVITGAADAFDVTVEELALACASHSAETEHVAAVEAWLTRLGLGEDDLECGADVPLGIEAQRSFIRSGGEPHALLNGCSGKHAGFLTVHRHLGEPIEHYIDRDSAVQRLVTEATQVCTGFDLSSQRPGVDGCGIPVYAVPLQNLALSMARLVDPVDLPDVYAAAAPRVTEAARRSFWVSGTGRTEHRIEEEATEPVLVKGGAEGMFMGALPERGLGFALKSADGSSRGAHAAVRAVLRHFGVLPVHDDPRGEALLNKAGIRSGEVREHLAAPLSASVDHGLTSR